MMTLLTQTIRADKEYAQLLETATKQFKASKTLPILINGLCEGASDAMLASLLCDLPHKGCALIVCPEEKECVRVNAMLQRFGQRSAFFIGRDFTFYNITASHEYEHERLDVLFGLLNGSLDAVVTTPDAALGYTIPPDRLAESVLRLNFNSIVDLNELIRKLVAAGYSRADMVDGKGQFAVRGGIVDIYPPNGHYTDEDGQKLDGSMALRIELFGDEIDRMGLFDVDSQRIHTTVMNVELPPAREILINDDVRDALKKAISAQFKTQHDEAVEQELIKEGHKVGKFQVGIMIETPASVLVADELAEEVDFFSLGTNDLTQYTCAIDRQNAKLERFSDTHHPAVLRAIKMTVDAGHRHGAWVGICGELGADPTLTETFLRMGVDELSVNAKSVLPLRKIIRSIDLSKSTEWKMNEV
jgi:transcription-repair coupling factor (superfamily II helicase)